VHWKLLYLRERKVLTEQYAKNMSDSPMCGCILGEGRIEIAEVSANWLALTPPFLDLGSLLAASITTADACGRDSLTLPFLVSSIPCNFTFILLKNTAHCLQFPSRHFKQFLVSAVILSVTQSRMGSHCLAMLLNSVAPWNQLLN